MFAAVAMFAAVSCQKEIITLETPEENVEVFEVIAVATEETKTTLKEGVKTYWTSSDALTVFDAEGVNQKFTTDITTDAASARFTTNKFAYTADPEAALIAVYPYTAGAALNGTTVTGLSLPTSQDASANNFDSKATIAYANGTVADNRNLKFNNAYGLFKFTIGEDNVTSVAISTNNKESLCGNVSLSIVDGKMTVVSSGNSTVTLKGTFTKGSVYYIAALPGTFSKGIKVTLGTASGTTEVKSTSNSVTLKANSVLELGTIQNKSEVTIPGGHNSWNTAATGTPMYYLTWWHVARNVAIGKNAFKFYVNGQWTGGTATSNVNTVYQGHGGGGSDIKISGATDSSAYDLYFNKNNYKYYITKTDESPWAVAGDFTQSWNDTYVMTPEKDYFVVRDVPASKDNFEYKFKFKNTWDFAYPNSNLAPKLKKGNYDFYIKKDMSAYACVAKGTTLQSSDWKKIQ